MMNKIAIMAPAFLVWGVLGSGGGQEGASHENTQTVAGLRRDQLTSGAAVERDQLVFGANKSGDYYEGALPP